MRFQGGDVRNKPGCVICILLDCSQQLQGEVLLESKLIHEIYKSYKESTQSILCIQQGTLILWILFFKEFNFVRTGGLQTELRRCRNKVVFRLKRNL